MTAKAPLCDLESGVCAPADLPAAVPPVPNLRADMEVVYIGDPMCSWCWGIAPALKQLEAWCAGEGLPFVIVVGGLRPGGGDQWNEGFKGFLRHHWEEIGQRTGQPFSFRLLEREFFKYDTEPACRAVVAARPLLGGPELGFFEAIQRRFYVDNEDPKAPQFYVPLCTRFGIDYGHFVERFASDAAKSATLAEFRMNRSWGVTGYPTVLIRQQDRLLPIATGFSTFAAMQSKVARIAAVA